LIPPLILASASAMNVHFDDCGHGEVKLISVSPCTVEPCMFNKGDNVTFETQFVASADADKAEVKITVTIDGIDIDYPLPDKDICKNHNVDCPLKKGTTYNAHFQITIDSGFPPTPATDIKLRLGPPESSKAANDDGDYACAKIKGGINIKA